MWFLIFCSISLVCQRYNILIHILGQIVENFHNSGKSGHTSRHMGGGSVSMTRILWLLATFKAVKIHKFHKILESPLIPNQLGRINKNDTKKSRKNISVKYHVAIYVSFMF